MLWISVNFQSNLYGDSSSSQALYSTTDHIRLKVYVLLFTDVSESKRNIFQDHQVIDIKQVNKYLKYFPSQHMYAQSNFPEFIIFQFTSELPLIFSDLSQMLRNYWFTFVSDPSGYYLDLQVMIWVSIQEKNRRFLLPSTDINLHDKWREIEDMFI